MSRLKICVDIDAPPSDVWTVMSDVVRWPDWTPTISEASPLTETPLSIGASFRVRQPRLPVATWTVTEFEAGSHFAWTSSAPGLRSRGDHRVEPLGQLSRAVLVFEQSGPLASLSSLVLSGLIGRYVRTEGASLKAFVERRSRAGGADLGR